jgi:hypothetical protein
VRSSSRCVRLYLEFSVGSRSARAVSIAYLKICEQSLFARYAVSIAPPFFYTSQHGQHFWFSGVVAEMIGWLSILYVFDFVYYF